MTAVLYGTAVLLLGFSLNVDEDDKKYCEKCTKIFVIMPIDFLLKNIYYKYENKYFPKENKKGDLQ